MGTRAHLCPGPTQAGGCSVALGPRCQAGRPGTPWPGLAHPPHSGPDAETGGRRGRPCPDCIVPTWLAAGRVWHSRHRCKATDTSAQTHIDNRTAPPTASQTQQRRRAEGDARDEGCSVHVGAALAEAGGGGGTAEAEPNLRANSSKRTQHRAGQWEGHGLRVPLRGLGVTHGPAATPPAGPPCPRPLLANNTKCEWSLATKAGSSTFPVSVLWPGALVCSARSHQALLSTLPTASRHHAILGRGPARRPPVQCSRHSRPQPGRSWWGRVPTSLLGTPRPSTLGAGCSGSALDHPGDRGGPGAALRPAEPLPTRRLGGRVWGGAPQGQGCRHVHPLPATGLLSAASPWGPPRGQAPPPLGRPWGSQPSWVSAWPS